MREKQVTRSRNAPALQTTFPEHRIERVDALIPYGNNARVHSAEQIARIATSITSFGFTNPILIDGGKGVIAGHGRLRAALYLGMETVPVIDLAHLTDAQRRAYILADNKLALDAGWDNELLKLELGRLELEAFDLNLTGFDALEIEALSAPEPDPETDWQGMPEFEQGDASAWRTISVHFNDAEAVALFAKRIGQEVTDKAKYIWFPIKERGVFVDKRYKDES